MKLHTKIITFLLHSLSIVQISCSSVELHVSKILRDGDTLVSAARSFELGFFSPTSTSRNRYLGIWFKNISSRTVVWVANRDSPVSAGTLNLDRSGNLVIVDGTNNLTVWSTNTSSENNPVLRLLDTGNLVLREEASDSVTWQSFDHLTDTFTPSMHLGWDLPTRHQNYLSSWRSDADPAPGEFTLSLDASGYPQLVIRRKDSLRYRIGPFNGVGFSGMPRLNPNTASSGALIINDSAVHYEWLDVDEYSSLVTRVTLSPGGVGRVMMWVDPGKYWTVYYKFPADMCDGYAVCGPHAACDSDGFPVCGCLERFVPRDEESWRRSDWSRGCVRRTLLTCSEEDVFLKYSGIKMPDARFTRSNKTASLKECEAMCLGNCSCSGYSDLDIRNGGSGCLMWFGDLVDIKRLPGEEQVIYVRMFASESGSKGVKRTTVVVIVVLASSAVLLLLLGLILSVIRKTTDRKLEDNNDEEMELPMYDLSTVFKATDGFSVSNKLGEGGFGPVYKGILADGKEIAVKRLSETSSQGLEEFKNEVLCIAKLQHRNLVKLLGWCIEGEEKMLIYEYMPNKSLDLILFDEVAKKDLDCAKRLRIINGVARGLLYLHQDSCLRVIHRDLKASNVLLDNDLNPKISDFGMARIFEGNETGGKTRRVVGTYGYMPPEYAVDGFFSLKSDVYSFGVLVLEIVSGHTNRGFEHTDHHHNLVGHAWILYKDGRLMELVDPMIIDDSLCLYELLRSIHVALLCVQRRPEDRPSMSTVVLMLGSGGVLPEAKEPGFFTERHGLVVSGSNEYTVTQIEAR